MTPERAQELLWDIFQAKDERKSGIDLKFSHKESFQEAKKNLISSGKTSDADEMSSSQYWSYLLKKGATLERVAKDGSTQSILYRAVDRKMVEAALWAIENGANLDSRSKGPGATPLHRACHRGSNELVEAILPFYKKAGLLHAQDGLQRTPFDKAIEGGKIEIMEMLKLAGANWEAGLKKAMPENVEGFGLSSAKVFSWGYSAIMEKEGEIPEWMKSHALGILKYSNKKGSGKNASLVSLIKINGVGVVRKVIEASGGDWEESKGAVVLSCISDLAHAYVYADGVIQNEREIVKLIKTLMESETVTAALSNDDWREILRDTIKVEQKSSIQNGSLFSFIEGKSLALLSRKGNTPKAKRRL